MVDATDDFDTAFAFFDDVFAKVPPIYRQVSADYLEAAGASKKQTKKEPALSLAEINERA
jgi:hypothetical protein